jgi:hypothetical protein
MPIAISPQARQKRMTTRPTVLTLEGIGRPHAELLDPGTAKGGEVVGQDLLQRRAAFAPADSKHPGQDEKNDADYRRGGQQGDPQSDERAGRSAAEQKRHHSRHGIGDEDVAVPDQVGVDHPDE